jgi:CrcB protein
MQAILSVAVGGAVGALARYGLSLWITARAANGWPWATFTINVVGSALIGVLVGWTAGRESHEPWRLLLGVGVLGGFTTFSSYSLETVQLVERNDIAGAAAYSLGSVLAGGVACFLALWLSRKVFA